MGTLREVQGKQKVHGIGKAVLMLVCVSILSLAGGCSRETVTNATTPRSETPSTSPLTQETATKTATVAVIADTSAKDLTAAKADTASTAGTTVSAGTSATTLLTSAATSATSAPTAPAPVLYESIAYGVRVSETGSWVIQKSFDTPSLKVVFGHEKIQAILSVLSPDKTGKAILGELLQGLGDVEVISRTDNSLEVRTRYTDSMRTIAYVERAGRFNYLLVFVTPDNGLEQRRDAMASLISGLDYLG